MHGGYTGGSLALTSRFTRETERLIALVALYQNQCPSTTAARSRTAHLYLSTSKPAEDEDDCNESEGEGSARCAAIHQLFRLVTTDLQSLDTPRPLPALFRHADLSTQVRVQFPRTIPALIHLHIVAQDTACLASAPQPPLFAGWAAHAPRVTYLRVSIQPPASGTRSFSCPSET